MDLKLGKRKKLSMPNDFAFLPTLSQGETFSGHFNGLAVVVKDFIQELHDMGFYGKGNLSRSVPSCNFTNDLPEVITSQQYLNRQIHCYGDEFSLRLSTESRKLDLAKESIDRFLVRTLMKKDVNGVYSMEWLACSGVRFEQENSDCLWIDDEVLKTEGTMPDLVEEILESCSPRELPIIKNKHKRAIVVEEGEGPKLHVAPPAPIEVLQLNLQEAFFLNLIGRLRVLDVKEKELDIRNMWNLFRLTEDDFLKRYVAYHWYRSKGWVVRPGIKYGSDFLLYEKGPPFCHSSYIVHVVLGEVLSWSEIIMLQRATETSKKDLLFCFIIPPTDLKEEELESPDVISRYQVQESICRRWIPSQQRVTK